MRLERNMISGGRINDKNIIEIKYSGKYIFSLYGHCNVYTVFIGQDGWTVYFKELDDSYYSKNLDPYFNMGDGTIYNSKISSHTYENAGTYTIITSAIIDMDKDKSNDSLEVKSIDAIRRDILKLRLDNSSGSIINYNDLRYFKPKNTNINNIDDMSYLFYGCKKMTESDLSVFDTNQTTDMKYMFYNCNKLSSLDVTNFDTSHVTDMKYMFYGCSLLTELNLSNFNTSQVTDMSFMFDICSNLINLDLTNFNTSKVTNMSTMFGWFGNSYKSTSTITTLNLSSFNTSQVTDMSWMFYYCTSLEKLDLSNFDTKNVTNMANMFNYCYRLKELDLSNFDTSNVTTVNYMFNSCNLLQKLHLNNCSSDTISRIINSNRFPTGTVNGEKRKIYYKVADITNLTEPEGWEFVPVS
jgi:surface protein